MAQNLEYIDQSAFGLRLNIIEGNLDKKQFNILDNGVLITSNLILEAEVIGSSHILTFSNTQTHIHEVFACKDKDDIQTGSKRVFYGSLDKVAGGLNLDFGGYIHYKFKSQLFSWADGELFLNDIEELARTGDKAFCLALSHEFPNRKLETIAKTIVFAKIKEEGMDISTVHSYPNEGNIVITKTLVKSV